MKSLGNKERNSASICNLGSSPEFHQFVILPPHQLLYKASCCIVWCHWWTPWNEVVTCGFENGTSRAELEVITHFLFANYKNVRRHFFVHSTRGYVPVPEVLKNSFLLFSLCPFLHVLFSIQEKRRQRWWNEKKKILYSTEKEEEGKKEKRVVIVITLTIKSLLFSPVSLLKSVDKVRLQNSDAVLEVYKNVLRILVT